MANANVSLLGQSNLAGDALATFQKIWTGEVYSIFEKALEFKNSSVVKTIQHGKSASFSYVGRASAYYHTRGNELNGANVAQTEQIVNIDQMLVSPIFIADIDDLMNHYDSRSEFVRESAYSLASAYDSHVAQIGVLAARSAEILLGEGGGTVLTQANFASDAAVLTQGIINAAKAMDEKNVPKEGRIAFLPPTQYYLLFSNKDLINSYYGGRGSIADGTVFKVAGVEIVMTNNLPQSNVITGPAAYQGNFSTTVGLVMHRSAVGTVQLKGMTSKVWEDNLRVGSWINTMMAIGHGILRPESAVELKTA
jgi:hypothetical protein